MNLTPLIDLKDCLSKSAIAGIRFMPEDFRLKRAVEQMAPLAALAPVFKNIYNLAQSAISADCEDRSSVILDTLALLDAILCTQSAVNEEKQPIEPISFYSGKLHISEPYSTLAPFIEAISGSGGGRQATLEKIYNNRPEIINDYRIKPALVEALSDSYSSIAVLVKGWLRNDDGSIIPLLKNGFNPKGKSDMVRRFEVIRAVAGAQENDFYLSLLKSCNKNLRQYVITALQDDKNNVELLLKLVKTEKDDCKTAAQDALSHMDAKYTKEYWQHEIQNDPKQVTDFLRFNSEDVISDIIAVELDSLINRLINQESEFISENDFNRLSSLLTLALSKTSDKICETYRKFAENMQKLLPLIRDEEHYFSYMFFSPRSLSKEYQLNQTISIIMIDTMLITNDEKIISLAQELYEKYGDDFAAPAFAAALITRPKQEVYDTFAPLFTKEGLFDKIDEFTIDLRLSLLDVFGMISYSTEHKKYCINVSYHSNNEEPGTDLYEPLDDRFYELLTNDKLIKYGKINHTKSEYVGCELSDFDHILVNLINPDNEVCQKYVGPYLYKKSIQTSNNEWYIPYLKALKWKNYSGLISQYFCKQHDNYEWEDVCPNSQPCTDAENNVTETVKPAESNDLKYYGNIESAMKWCMSLQASKESEEKK